MRDDATEEQPTPLDATEELIHLAEIWDSWVKSGTVSKGLKKSFYAKDLPLIQAKKVIPEVFLRYRGLPTLYRWLTKLSTEDQKRLVATGVVTVKRQDGRVEKVPLHALEPSDCKRVFRDGRIVPADEQVCGRHSDLTGVFLGYRRLQVKTE